MPYCKNCGSEVSSEDKFCPSCGVSQHSESASSPHFSDDVNDNRNITILSYIGPLAFIPYFSAKRSPFARFHSMRGLNLFILEGIYAVASSVLQAIASSILTLLGVFVMIANYAGWAFLIYISIRGIINVVNGRKEELPFLSSLSRFRIIKN